jgi:hypothetical protein
MSGRSLFAILAIILLAVIVGTGAYQAGVAQGVAQTGAAATAVPVAYYAPHVFGWGFGFFPFGFLFPVLGFFLILALLRGLFFAGRWGGYGHRGWHTDGQHEVPGRFEEWHRRAHGDGAADRPAPPRQ